MRGSLEAKLSNTVKRVKGKPTSLYAPDMAGDERSESFRRHGAEGVSIRFTIRRDSVQSSADSQSGAV